MSFEIEVWSDREFQRIIKKEINEKYPDIDCDTYVKKSGTALQYTQIIIGLVNLLISILNIIIISRNRENKKINIKISDDTREIELDALEHDIDVNKVIKDFLNKK